MLSRNKVSVCIVKITLSLFNSHSTHSFNTHYPTLSTIDNSYKFDSKENSNLITKHNEIRNCRRNLLLKP